RCRWISLATAAIGLSRLWVARQNQRVKQVRAAPGYRYSQKVRKRSLSAQTRPTLKSSRCKARSTRRCSGGGSAGRRSHRYLDPVSRASPSRLSVRWMIDGVVQVFHDMELVEHDLGVRLGQMRAGGLDV